MSNSEINESIANASISNTSHIQTPLDIYKLQLDLHRQVNSALNNFGKDPENRKTITYFETRIEKLTRCYSEFEKYHIQLIQSDLETDHVYYTRDFASTFEELYLTARSEIVEAFKSKFPTTTLPGVTANVQRTSTRTESVAPSVRLPKLMVPNFSGKYTDWPAFHDAFLRLIHNNLQISNIEKFNFLRSALPAGYDRDILELPLTNENYIITWQTLVSRYNNPRVLFTHYMQMFFSQSTIVKENGSELKRLIDTSRSCLSALRNLEINVDECDQIFVHFLISKLPRETHQLWEQELGSSREIPTFKRFSDFIEIRYRTLEAIEFKANYSDSNSNSNSNSALPIHQKPNFKSQSNSKSNFRRESKVNHISSSIDSKQISCVHCKESHIIRRCPKFLAMDCFERKATADRAKLCVNCLSSNHLISTCPSTRNCQQCGKRHHTLLHFPQPINDSSSSSSANQTNTSNHTISTNHIDSQIIPLLSNATKFMSKTQVLLPTAVVKVRTSTDSFILLRTFVDQGSTGSLISERAVQTLKLKRWPIITDIKLPDGQKTSAKFVTQLTIQSRINDNIRLDVIASVVNSVTENLPTKTISYHDWSHLRDIELADPEYYRSTPIDLLIGSDLYDEIILQGLRKGQSGEPIAQQTTLGWIVSGKAVPRLLTTQPNNTLNCSHISLENLDSLVKQFYALESIPTEDQYTAEEKWCQEYYQKTTVRQPNGKYLVRLPLKMHFDGNLSLGRTYQAALNRFYSLERKLNKNDDVRQQYCASIQEYFDLNQIAPVKTSEEQHLKFNNNNQPTYTCCTLPHHAVFRDSLTTQCRVVYDASAVSSSGKSLNNVLCTGPRLLNDLPAVLLNWRLHVYVITADIAKMFRCIDMHDEDSEYQRIIWRDSEGNIKQYKLTTVTFGTAPAPYLANETIHQIARDERERYPLAHPVLMKQIYVDDVYTGSEFIETAIEIRNQTRAALSSAGMKLHKWASNSIKLLESIPSDQLSSATALDLNSGETLKTLGMRWQPNNDCFRYQLKFDIDFTDKPITKRTVLSAISKLFDPLGLINPVIVTAKIFLKHLWSFNLDWDQQLPDDLINEWKQIAVSLQNINHIQIPRWLNYSPSSIKLIEIHAFCDGSAHAYASIVYLRVQDDQGKYHCNIITAKSKVTPKPPICIPRIELCAAVLSIKLVKWVLKHINIPENQIEVYYWTDATIVLSWIRGDINRWPVFVANRIGLIHTDSNFTQWHHISTHENPADHSSRGLTPAQLINCELYWHGPTWLCEPKEKWPVSNWTFLEEEKAEQLINIAIKTSDELSLFDRYSSYTRLLRITAMLLRFKHNLTASKENRLTGILTVAELHTSLVVLVRIVQRQCFYAEFKALNKKGMVSSKSQLISLVPFLDDDKIVRVRGRLRHATIPYHEKHPIILPKDHRFTQLLIDYAHQSTLHGGIQLTSAFLRKRFWIIHAKKIIKSSIKKCVICFRQRPQISQQLMGDLPAPRVTSNIRPFLATGVDYTGAIELKASRYRGHTTYKGYIAVFICLATKAVHLEAVSGMSTDQFLFALQRFLGHHGLCHDIYSDCGTNFIGAEKVLKTQAQKFRESVHTDIVPFLANKGIQWHFNPPHSPNFGGLWEANVKSVKYHLKRIMNGTTLTFEELATILARIQSCLNSRPLCALSADSDDLSVLTPGHFLIGNSLLAPPEPAVLNESPTRQYFKLQRLIQQFWSRWSADWLNHLQSRPKWHSQQSNLKINDLVIIKDDRLPPNQWILGRIIETHPGADNLIRVVTVRTQNGNYKRCVSKICRLPIDDTHEHSI